MSKKPILSKFTKIISALVLVFLITITLTACDTANKQPTSGINLDEVYASNGTYSVTVREVFDKLRYNVGSYLDESIYNVIYAEEIKTVKENVATYKDRLDELVLEDIYGTSDKEDIAEIKDKDVKIATYVDEMYQKGIVISKDEILNETFTAVYPVYYVEVAKYVAAKNDLTSKFEVNDGVINFGEINDDSYFTTDDVVNYYKNNYKNKGEVTAILVRFINSAEASNVLKQFGLKESGGKFYQIPLPSDLTEVDNKPKYDAYYDETKLNIATTGLASIDEYGNGNATVLKVYAAIYNYVYSYRNPIELTDKTVDDFADKGHLQYYYYLKDIIDTDNQSPVEGEYETLVSELLAYEEANDETIVMSNEKLNKYSATLANKIYNLPNPPAEGEDSEYAPYYTKAQSAGSYYYLMYKVDQEADKELFDDSDEDNITFPEENKEFLQQVLEEMFEEKLNDKYISDIMNARIDETSIKIYDSIVEKQFMYTSGSIFATGYETNKDKNNDLIAEVTYKGNTTALSVAQIYNYLEPLYGPQVAQNLLFQKYIKDQDKYYGVLESKYDQYVETIETMLYYFSNDYYASSGYPAEIGTYDFMMLYFGTADVDTAVRNFLMVSDATSAFYSDFSGYSNDKFYQNVYEYQKDSYEDFYSLTVSGIQVFVDRDEDNVPDEITDTPLNAEGDTLRSLAEKLLDAVYTEVANSTTDYETAINNVIAEYNKSSRIPSTNPTAPESKWAAFRAEGLYVSYSSIGTYTNTSVNVDENIANRVKELKDNTNVVDPKLGFTSKYLDNEPLLTDNDKLTYLLVTSAALPTSAKFESDNEVVNEIYSSIDVILNGEKVTISGLTYDKDEITVDQIKVYVAEYLLFGDVYSLPTTTVAALDAYVLPILTKFTGTASQYIIERNIIGTVTYSYNGELSDAFNDAFTTAYTRSGYMTKYYQILQDVEDQYQAPTYENWWEKMYA